MKATGALLLNIAHGLLIMLESYRRHVVALGHFVYAVAREIASAIHVATVVRGPYVCDAARAVERVRAHIHAHLLSLNLLHVSATLLRIERRVVQRKRLAVLLVVVVVVVVVVVEVVTLVVLVRTLIVLLLRSLL